MYIYVHIDSHQLLAISISEQIITTVRAISMFDIEIDKLFYEQPDAELFESLPSAGPCMAPRLLVAFGENRDRFTTASEVQMYAGVAPVTVRSGQKSWVHWRWQCSTFLRQSFILLGWLVLHPTKKEGKFPSIGGKVISV